MAEWKLRAGRAADLAAMYALDLDCFEEPFRFDLKSMRRFASQAGAMVVVAQAAKDLIGFVIVQMERGRLAYVVTLDVAPARRRRGLARALMAEAEQQARDAGADRMGLHVFIENAEAITFYEGLGYERKSLDEGFYGEGLDALVYLKELAIRGSTVERSTTPLAPSVETAEEVTVDAGAGIVGAQEA
jgi:ribosomal-protein-alanine N-acetyltransferase